MKVLKTKADYREAHPDWRGNKFVVLWVTLGECTANIEALMGGETRKLQS